MADSTNDTTKALLGPNERFGAFEPDPNDPFVQRYIPADSELERIESWMRDEVDRAWDDDQPSRQKKLQLLDAYHALPEGQQQILTLPLVKRTVNQNVAWTKEKIMTKHPLVTVTPDSGDKITVLVPDQTFGAVPIEKTSDEVAQALEIWLEYKFRKRIPFDRIVETACFEAKRGQTPTWIAIRHKKETRKVRAPKFENQGPIAVTFQTKDEIDVQVGEATRLENVSTYSMLMPMDEQEPQESRWIAERVLPTTEDVRRALYNRDYFLIPKKEWDELIEQEGDNALMPDEQRKASIERRTAQVPKGRHDVWLVWFFWSVPMKKTLVSIDGATGEQTLKTIKTFQEYSFCGYFHKKAGKLLSMIRNPFDHGMRPYVPVFDRKEPFRHTGGSIAEDVLPYQRVMSQLNSLEIRGAVIATTPVTFAEPGSVAGEWAANNPIEPGSLIPRLRPEEMETKALGERPQSLLGLISFHQQQADKDVPNSSDLQLGLELPARTPASTLGQIMNAGETQAAMFLDSIRRDLSDAVKLYVQTVQQYMRFGEVIPFDAETKATIESALQGNGQTPTQQDTSIPVRFPMAPLHEQFAFNITASSEDRSQQGDFEKLVALKKLIDADGAIVAQMVGPMASGQLPQSITDILVADFKRREKAMELIGKAMRKDGGDFAISPKLLTAMVQEQKQMAQMRAMNPPPPTPPPPPQIKINLSGQLPPFDVEAAAQKAGIGGQGGPQGTQNQGGVSQPPNQQGGLGQPVPQSGIPQLPFGGQGGGASAPSPPIQ